MKQKMYPYMNEREREQLERTKMREEELKETARQMFLQEEDRKYREEQGFQKQLRRK